MRRLNLIAVYEQDGRRLLMCRRRKEPYKGLLNLVGGKAEAGETDEEAAYRELWEETALTKADIRLMHIMELRYFIEDMSLAVYAGTLKSSTIPHGDENELIWVDAGSEFADCTRFAGDGNLLHILRVCAMHLHEGDEQDG
ncbi:MAG: NUDIX domain-containing protein [Oscillospiraceae bacterium]|nr:NUDIX domain-containing protein [Oscillospiraceae bacterium]